MSGFGSIFRKLSGYFLRGILYTVPVFVTGYVIYRVFWFFDTLFKNEISQYLPGIYFPGIGMILLLLALTVLGFLGSTLIAQPIISMVDRWLERAPLVKTFYSALKDLVSAFVGKKKRFNKPVLVKLSRESEVEKLGFMTQSDLEQIGIKSKKVAVYLPHSYAFSGNLFIVPSENVTPIDASPADVMKFILSGGVSELDRE